MKGKAMKGKAMNYDNSEGSPSLQNLMGRRTFLALGGTAMASIALFGFSGCAPKESSNEGDAITGQSYVAGTYTGVGDGKKGDITAEVAFADNAIESIVVVDSNETSRIAATPFAVIPEQIITHQSLAVDTVTGATLSSFGILNAVKDCVTQAGGDVRALESVALPKKEEATETLDVDIAVIGGGAAGMGTAIEASMKGMKVAVFEKCANLGGNMLVSGGAITYINAPQELRQQMNDSYRAYFDSTVQRAREIGAPQDIVDKLQSDYDAYYAEGNTTVFDSPEWQTLYKKIATGVSTLDERDLKYSLDQYNENDKMISWLDAMDVELGNLVAVGGYPWPSASQPVEGENGEGFCLGFDRYIGEGASSIDILFQTPASELMTNDDGEVIGVKGICADGITYEVKAGKGVVIATGGFAGSTDLLIEHDDEWGFKDMGMTSIPTTNAYGHTGDGLLMAMSVGGAYSDTHPNIMVLPFVNAVDQSVESIVGSTGDSLLVNKSGKRFVNETIQRNDIARAFMKEEDQMGYLISDKVNSLVVDGINGQGIAIQPLLETNKIFTDDTIEGLAEQIGIDPGTLAATVEAYNSYVEAGSDPDFNRIIFTEVSKVTEPPFYAQPAGWGAHITNAGLSVDRTTSAVLDSEGNPVGGLYAVGEVTDWDIGVTAMLSGLLLADQLAS